MKLLRTPDEQFKKLHDYPFAPNYLELGDPDGSATTIRMHYLDEGPRDGIPVLLLHGEPMWSYLYRKMIPGLVAAGYRVIAPDQIGFGKSDKPSEKSDYSVARHVSWIRECIQKLELQNAIFFGQDWGSLIGLTAVLHEESRFQAIVTANAMLPDPAHFDRFLEAQKVSPDETAFARWQAWIADKDSINIGQGLKVGFNITDGLRLDLNADEVLAYNAPYPDGSYQAGVLEFPALANLNKEAIELFDAAWRVLEKWQKPFITAYGKADPILGFFDQVFQKYVPGAKGQPHKEFPDGGHFIQEQQPEELVDSIVAASALGPTRITLVTGGSATDTVAVI